jgi:protein O-mannosyl-transferase
MTERTWCVAAVVAAIVAVIFAPAIGNGWVNWDDRENFVDNPHFRGFSSVHLRWMFTTTQMGHYIPVTWLTLAADHALWEMDPRGYHATNVVFHALNAALLFLIARRLLPPGGPAGAVVAALVFALHPLRVESVAWITERRDVVSGFLLFLALLAYLHAVENGAARRWWLGGALVAFAASLLAKAITMTFPLLLMILDAYSGRRISRRSLAEKVPFLGLGLAGAVVALAVVHTSPLTSWEHYGLLSRLGMVLFNLAFYVSRTLLPMDLSPMYELPVTVSLLAPPFLLSGIATVALTIAAVAFRRKAPWFTAAWAAYVVMVLPISGPVRGGLSLAHDRYSYLACVPWAVLAGAGVQVARERWRRRDMSTALGLTATAAVVALLLTWTYLTVRQTKTWHDSEVLWRSAVAIDPACSVCRHNLGSALLERGHLEAAHEEIRLAVALRPNHASARLSLGAVLYRQGRYLEAAQEFVAAGRLRPDQPEPLNNLGVVYATLGRPAEAVAHFEAALRLRSDYHHARQNLARITGNSGPR